MKIMLFAGLILVMLGIASLLVPIPHTEKHGIKAGDVNIGVETTQSERVSPIISVVLIAGGIALTVGGARTIVYEVRDPRGTSKGVRLKLTRPRAQFATTSLLYISDYRLISASFQECASLTSRAPCASRNIPPVRQVLNFSWRLMMNLKIVTGLIALFMFASAAGLATAQDTTKTTHKKTRTLTGCLQKGEDANEYNFIAKDGGTWEIKSDSVKLDEHVGHTVKIVGVVSNAAMHGMKEDAKEEMKEHGMDKHTAERGHMTVTHLTMVSDTCQK